MKKNVIILLCFITSIAFSQTGIVRGKIIDKQSEKPIIGAKVEIIGQDGIVESTDSEGNFKLNNVALGRQNIQVIFEGYENAYVSEIDVTTGKEVILTISMIEKFNTIEEVVVTGGTQNKAKANNKMAVVSARQFSAEEANRYAGGRSDVSRLASNFAGVSTADDSRNDIVIRGNSPSGLLWRLEGIPVPSPNHFATLGTTGSPVSALNSNMLGNSDFITSAFPAEYGNAIGGVFDLGFRKGNTENYEYSIGMAAFPGLEAMAEGPMLKKNGGAFVAAARYGVVGVLGLAGTTAVPNYNDISFNLDFGKSKLGNFSLFGILGNSNIEFLGKDIDETDLFASKDEDAEAKSNFSAFGLKHTIDLGKKSYLKTTIGSSSAQSTYESYRYFDYKTPLENRLKFTDVDNTESRVTFSTLINSKISNKFTLRTGFLYESFNLDASITDRDRQADTNGDGYPDFVSILKNDGNYSIAQPYTQALIRLTEKLTLNAGLHAQYFSVNEQFVIEPRSSLSYAINSKSALSLGYGVHHQNVAAPILFLNENIGGNLIQTNKNLDLVRSDHYVLGYDLRFADKWRAKAELYYQSIDKAAVERIASGYSSLTEGASFVYSIDKTSLVSQGKGTNSGIELTLEKFFSKGYNVLFTSSLFESKYKGSDGVERNSPFNNGYVVNALAGKEFKIGKTKKNIFSINTKFTTAGGRYYTPVDLAASQLAGYEIKDDTKLYSEQYDPYLRLDLKFGMKLNSKSKKRSHQFYVDFQNVTANENVFTKEYNRQTGVINQKNQIGFQPDFGYRFNF
jgi:hypothetical protein